VSCEEPGNHRLRSAARDDVGPLDFSAVEKSALDTVRTPSSHRFSKTLTGRLPAPPCQSPVASNDRPGKGLFHAKVTANSPADPPSWARTLRPPPCPSINSWYLPCSGSSLRRLRATASDK